MYDVECVPPKYVALLLFFFLTDRRAAVSATQRAHPPFVCVRRCAGPFVAFSRAYSYVHPATATTTNMLGLYISQ